MKIDQIKTDHGIGIDSAWCIYSRVFFTCRRPITLELKKWKILKSTDLMTTIPMAFIQQTIFMRSRLIILEQQQWKKSIHIHYTDPQPAIPLVCEEN